MHGAERIGWFVGGGERSSGEIGVILIRHMFTVLVYRNTYQFKNMVKDCTYTAENILLY